MILVQLSKKSRKVLDSKKVTCYSSNHEGKALSKTFSQKTIVELSLGALLN